ncbi:spore coat U domain-containing protein [Alishewanella sp. SMS8]|uniref:Csu type fimbrial protein n=1 Tax=Alishewanella sp. SMS8 TaxID=2994676 RepID=UPI0027422FE7|nr:spore coat U domain-containing protein [Alishewanella sp. SMS8]MDP5458061.1 spore coat U domain-containing protein [Alishewanella sp. SMS8]
MNGKRFVVLLSMFTGFLYGEQAQDVSEISIQIAQGCVLDNGSGGHAFGTINFGEHSNLLNGVNAISSIGNGSIGFRCSPNLSFRVELGNGQNATGSNRQLLNSTTNQLIPYQLFQDAARSLVWDSNNAVTGTANGKQKWLTIYGAISPQASTPSAGQYRDSVEVLLVF